MYQLHLGDCLEVLKTLPDACVDSVVTDPPYELGFMGKRWDASGIAYNVALWTEALRVLRPGGHLLAFGGTRTYHRMACAIEDAGFEIRDSLHWVYGSGFPKSLDVSKAIDKAAGAERVVVGRSARHGGGIVGNGTSFEVSPKVPNITAPATDAAKEWAGWGTALKPSHEPVVVARKPLVGTVAANVLEHGTGALNIDGCRVGGGGQLKWSQPRGMGSENSFADDAWTQAQGRPFAEALSSPVGRWPPNLLLSHTPECGETCAEDCAVAEMDRQSGIAKPKPQRTGRRGGNRDGLGMGRGGDAIGVWPEDFGGGASRFFPVFKYQAKASRSERDAAASRSERDAAASRSKSVRGDGGAQHTEGVMKAWNHHPTVKPVELMRWLVRLVTPCGGVVLDPFTGSGTTGVAAMQQGFAFIGIEREPEYHAIATARIEHAVKRQPAQMELVPA